MTLLDRPPVFDAAQLDRIEAVHRGFLYQHLYAVRCLLLTPGTDVLSVVVESDEDVEVVRAKRRTYVQIKSRSSTLGNADVEDAIARFEVYRALHRSGERSGACEFVLATNSPLAPSLAARVAAADWPADIRIDRPAGPANGDPATPIPPAGILEALEACRTLAAGLPFGLLSPETLVWKLAGVVTAAATGARPRIDHAFRAQELAALFEQLLVQLQDFPAPPPIYRAQVDEPALLGDAPVRLVAGWSGAGKTAWVAQAAAHAPFEAAYLDVRDTPGPTLASALSRDLAARLYATDGQLGRVVLPGASGLEVLRAIDRRLADEGRVVLAVIDNAHAPPPEDLAAVIVGMTALRFVLLSHPGTAAAELSVRLRLEPEVLKGWSADVVAEEAAAAGCRADPKACEELLALTGGLPLYVQNAMSAAKATHAGDVGLLCAELATRTHSVETAQELILSRLVQSLPPQTRRTLGLLSVCDFPLARGELIEALQRAYGTEPSVAAADLRRLRTVGALEVFGGDRLKVHDAVRLLGGAELDVQGADARMAAFSSLREVLQRSVRADWAYPKVKLLLRVIGETGDARTLVQLGGDEIFHELGFWPEIAARLQALADNPAADATTRFWALDGMMLALMRDGSPEAPKRLAEMRNLADSHSLDVDALLAVGMKEMMHFAKEGRREDALRAMRVTSAALPNKTTHRRIFRYNAAVALFHLGENERAAADALSMSNEYYRILGVQPNQVVGANPPTLRKLLRDSGSIVDDCKHLADCLDLFAKATNRVERDSGLARMHAMKFYDLAQAPESLVRVGQDLIDEFVRRRDFTGALQVFESAVLPIVRDLKLAAHVVPVRAQYAVVLAYCRRFADAEAEMSRLRLRGSTFPRCAG